MKYLSILVVLACTLTSCINKHSNAHTDEINNKYYFEYNRIYKSYGKVPLDTTVNDLIQYLQKFPKSFEAYCFMAAIDIRRHQYDKAETSYKTALAYNPKYRNALVGLSVLYSWSGRNDSASMYINQAIKSGDSSIATSICLAIIDLKRGDSTSAAAINAQINKIDSLDNTDLIFLAGINHELKNQQKLSAILTALDHRNVKDSLLDLCIDNKINATDFFNQKGQSISYGK